MKVNRAVGGGVSYAPLRVLSIERVSFEWERHAPRAIPERKNISSLIRP